MPAIPKDVIEHFVLKKAVSRERASSLFKELEQFLSLGSANSTPAIEVDEAWHEFILHTRLYADYCANTLGRFIHHVPQKPALKRDGKDVLADCESESCSKCSPDCNKS